MLPVQAPGFPSARASRPHRNAANKKNDFFLKLEEGKSVAFTVD